MKYERVSMSPEESQLLQSRLFTVQDVARFLRMPLAKIQEDSRSTFSNVEQKGLEYVDDTLMSWAVRWEEEIGRKMDLASDEFAQHDFRQLRSGDLNARANYFRTRFGLGSLSPNDIREYEGENPIDDPAADEYYLQLNTATLEAVAEGNPAEGESEPGVTGNQGGDIPPDKSGDAESAASKLHVFHSQSHKRKGTNHGR